jgi:hypothetical protein
MTTVFVSHSTKDRAAVESLIIEPLEKSGAQIWYSKESIRGGQEWQQQIVNGLEKSEYFLVVLSTNAEQSKWVHSEVSWAIENRSGKILPVILNECNLHRIDLRLSRIQTVKIGDTDKVLAFVGPQLQLERSPLSSWQLVRPLLRNEEIKFLEQLVVFSEDLKKHNLPYPGLNHEHLMDDQYHKLDNLVNQAGVFISDVVKQKEPMWKFAAQIDNLIRGIESASKTRSWGTGDILSKLKVISNKKNIINKLAALQDITPNSTLEKKSSIWDAIINYWTK